MTLTSAERALRQALADNEAPSLDSITGCLQDKKAKILGAELGMTILETNTIEEPVGLERVWEYLQENQNRIGIAGDDRLKGLLFVGPPGTGKTMIAKAIGRWVKLPVINFEIGRLIFSLVGATENNILRATATIESLAPAVVFIDEIEKALSGADSSNFSDGGTMARSYGTLLTWLNDTQAPVIVIGTANRLDQMGEFGRTLARRGRFDELFFIDWPNGKARMAMLTREIERHGGEIDKDSLIDLAGKADGFSGADLVAAVREAMSKARFQEERLTAKHIEEKVQLNIPRIQARKSAYDRLRQWAIANCRPACVED